MCTNNETVVFTYILRLSVGIFYYEEQKRKTLFMLPAIAVDIFPVLQISDGSLKAGIKKLSN